MNGNWKSYEELEDSLTLIELVHTVNAIHRREHRHMRFNAALQGVDLGDENESRADDAPSAEEVFNRAMEGKSATMSEEEALASIGIGYAKA